jgi:hypothetical protein
LVNEPLQPPDAVAEVSHAS